MQKSVNNTVNIIGAGFVNKGAELLLLSVLDRLKKDSSEFRYVVHSNLGHYEKRARLGLYNKLCYTRFGVQWGHFDQLIPRPICRDLGLIREKDINIILDASGFKYGDIWPVEGLQLAAKNMEKWKKNGKKIILLPQAFGPFTDRSKARFFKRIIQYTDLIFARDQDSYNYIKEIVPNSDNVRIAPDFTNLLCGTPSDLSVPKNTVGFVPNMQMLKHKSEKEQSDYINFNILVADRFREKGYQPVFIIHQTKTDLFVAKKINTGLKTPIEIIHEEDARKLKSIISRCTAVFGSRFHALVSALSQAVPSVGAGWSHKYEMLFQDYGCENMMLSPSDSEEKIKAVVDQITDPKSREQLVSRLQSAADEQKSKAENMWQEVLDVLKT